VKRFAQLGDLMRDEWREAEFDSRKLPDIACRVLHRSRLADCVTPEHIVDWVAETPVLPPQGDLASTFGQPPLVVYRDPRFFIEVLFWTTGTTAIHQHGFAGAFTVLAGSSIQTEYRFEVHDRVNAHMLLGDLTLERSTVLRRGDIQPIHPGDKLVHSVFHLEMPSVTVVVRSQSDQESGIQYQFLRPHLAIDPFFTDPAMTRRLQILALLDSLKSPRYQEIAGRVLQRADCLETFEVLRLARRHCGSHGALFAHLTDAARARHGSRIDRLLTVIDEAEREEILISRRDRILDRDHRFLLALLINLSDRDAILSMIGREYETTDPGALALEWLSGLSAQHVLGIEIDDLNALLLQYLVAGLSFEGICDRLSGEYLPEDVAAQKFALHEHCERLRHHAPLRPLLNVNR